MIIELEKRDWSERNPSLGGHQKGPDPLQRLKIIRGLLGFFHLPVSAAGALPLTADDLFYGRIDSWQLD